MNITILGGGSWGTALAVHLVKKKHIVTIWEFFDHQAKEMQEKRECPLLPGVHLPENITVSSDMASTLSKAELVLMVVPSDKVESTIEKAKLYLSSQPLIICSKGFAGGTKLLSEVVREKVSNPLFFLYGPTHAEEVGKGMLSGIVLAGGKGKESLQKELESSIFKIDVSDDIVGVQIAAALKNILAVFVGILDGMGLGDNAKAYIMTKGIAEITDVGISFGACRETFYGLAGIGDVIVTCLSEHSRNFRVGREIGRGRKLDEVLAETKMVAEGIIAAQHILALEQRCMKPLPLLHGIHGILFEGKNPMTVLEEL